MDEHLYESSIKELCERVNELEHLIYKGNGKPALIVQIAELQHQLSALGENMNNRLDNILEVINNRIINMSDAITTCTKNVDNLDDRLDTHISESEEYKANSNNNKTAIVVAVIACLGAILSNIVAVTFAK